MDWLRLFALLIAVASVHILAEGPKKKIRIHLPQKVKHIHHHKKIYITNHPASSQYAPAFLPSAEGAVAVPSNVALPAVASLLPLNSVELFDDAPSRLPGGSQAASKLLPLYRARGYYGPTPSEIDEQEYDLSPPPEPSDQSNEYAPPPASPPVPPKRVKIIKVNDSPRKKTNRKQKPKRGPVRSRPRPEPEDEHPVSSFHEQFYSDVDGSGTIRKIKRPQRVEKIIDGDTEHIHTYSEEHIHKVVFDDGPKLAGVGGMDHVGSMSALSAGRPLIPLNNHQALLALHPDSLSGFTAVGAPSHLEYTAYNPRDVTHDHIFHDHGEIPADADLTKDALSIPPKISYNSQGIRIGGNNKRHKSKYSNKYSKPNKPTSTNDFSYYESIYTPFSGLKKLQKPKIPQFDAQAESHVEDYRPIPSLKFLGKNKQRYGHAAADFRNQNASPFSVSSTVVHDYHPKASFPGALPPTGFTKFRDPFVNFKDNYGSNLEYDTFASSSNVHTSEDKNDNSLLSLPGVKGKKKSISTQNISFGGKGLQTTVDHLEESGPSSEFDDDTPTALENFSSFDETRSPDSVTSTPYTIRVSSPAYQYYTAMAVKALNNEPASAAEASNDNFQYAEAPTQSTTPATSSIATTTSTLTQFLENNAGSTETPQFVMEVDQKRRQKSKNTNKMNLERDHRQRYPVIMDYKSGDRPMSHKAHHQNKYLPESAADPSLRGQLKYGDKI